MNYTVFDIASKEIVRYGICPQDVFALQAGDGQGVLEGEYSSLTAYVDNNTVLFYTPEQVALKANKPDFFYYWSNESFSWVDSRDQTQKYNDAKSGVIIQRNALLYESDWTQIPNNPLTPEKQEEWAVYRQQLRDVTSQSGYPFNVVWPTKPE
jgi:hypothetical protein